MSGKRRSFDPAFKTKVVLELISGGNSKAEICRRESIASQQLDLWKQQFIENASKAFGDSEEKELESKIGDLERMVGRLTVENDILKKASILLTPKNGKGGRS